MGGTVGIMDQIGFQVQFHLIFVSDVMHKLESLFKSSRSARRSFIQYAEGNSWVDQIGLHGVVAKDLHGHSSIWKKFGYKDPFVTAGTCYSRSASLSAVSSKRTTDADGIDESSVRTTAPAQMDFVCKRSLFDDQELRAVLCFTLMSLYSKSEEYRALHGPHTLPVAKYESTAFAGCTAGKSHNDGLDRVRNMLLQAAASLGDNELDNYLSDPARSFIEDFRITLLNLPLSLLVSGVQYDPQEAKVLFVNHDPMDIVSMKWEKRGTRGWASTVGRDMCEVCSEDLSPGGARQVETAIFSAKGYKVSITDGKACKLRAVKPIFDAEGNYVYAVALETPIFSNPAQLQELGMFEQSEKQFHQINDLLALLPLLLKV